MGEEGEAGLKPSVRFDEMMLDVVGEEEEVDLEQAWLVRFD